MWTALEKLWFRIRYGTQAYYPLVRPADFRDGHTWPPQYRQSWERVKRDCAAAASRFYGRPITYADSIEDCCAGVQFVDVIPADDGIHEQQYARAAFNVPTRTELIRRGNERYRYVAEHEMGHWLQLRHPELMGPEQDDWHWPVIFGPVLFGAGQ